MDKISSMCVLFISFGFLCSNSDPPKRQNNDPPYNTYNESGNGTTLGIGEARHNEVVQDYGNEIDTENVDKESELEHRLEAEFVETPNGKLRPRGLHIFDKDEIKAENLDHHHYKKKLLRPRSKEKRNFNVGILDSLWPNGVIPYTITHSRTAARILIARAIEEFNKHTCIQWVLRTQEKNYVAFENGAGCGSWVGIVGGRQSITLQDPNCVNFETVLHEMCHAVGQLHEQSRHDRNPYIRTNWKNIPIQWAYNFDMGHTQDLNPYDQHSVLQYSLFSFSTNDQKKSMYLTDSRLDFLTEQTRNLTFYDIKDITDTYHCTKECSSPPVCENGGFVNFLCQCVCPTGLTGATCTQIDGNCGEIKDLTVGTSYIIKSSNYPENYDIGDKCVWVLKAPVGVKIKATVTDMDIAYNHDLTRCYHWLEVQYNLIGQPGIVKCGELQAGQTLEYETSNNKEYNIMMFKFNSQFITNRNPTRGFFMVLTAFTAGCHNKPCKSGGTCIEGPEENGSFTCLCLPEYSGSTCTEVKATAAVGCSFETDTSGECFLESDRTADLEWSMMSEFYLGSRTIQPKSGHIMAGLSIYKLTYYGDVARLITNLDFEAGPRCLQLEYQITVFENDTNFYLDISYIGINVTNVTSLLYQTTDTSNSWEELSLDIPSVEGLKITIEAAVGDREVMIDNLLLSAGLCRPVISYSCTFEDGTACFLSQSKGDNLDWTITSKETATKKTGPSVAAEGIYFSYLETSSTSLGQTAVYESSTLVIPADRCLMFYYHMFGLSVGSLAVKTKGTSLPETVTWIKYYSQGNRWHHAGVDIPSIEGLQIFIEATSGGNFMGDIALDNVIFRPGLCLCDSSPCLFGGTCAPLDSSTYQCRCAAGFSGTHCQIIDNAALFCSFENTFCSFLEQDYTNDTTDWLYNQGYTASSSTGPSYAASGTYYLFLESSGNAGLTARLNSLQLSATKHCLTFFYHMYGSHTGSLYILTDDGGGEKIQWTRSGDQGQKWHQAKIDLDLVAPTKVIIEGVIGNGFRSDISIDLVSVLPLECNTSRPYCEDNPCQNSGVCNETGLSFTCTCVTGYIGSQCELEVIDGDWGSWTNGVCSVSCEGEGQQTRTRICDNPAPANGGAQCTGSSNEVVTCNNGACPIDGIWGSWTSDSCSASCGDGQQTKSRICDSPAPANGGAPCEGSDSEVLVCNSGACPGVDGNWGSWTIGDCSASCGNGQQTKSRVCDNPAPANGGTPCFGSASSVVACNDIACSPINGEWRSWTGFSSCPVSCGGGNQSRSRTCDNPPPEHGGADCIGSSTESKSCNDDECPIDVIYRCTFEAEENSCFMGDESNPSRDVFDWTTHSGPTILAGTGPLSAVNGSYYKYIETLRPRIQGQNARLINVQDFIEIERCLSFFYHMNGPHIGTLRILMVNSSNGETTELWSKTGNQGNVWRQTSINIITKPGLQIAIDGIVGYGIRGNIAIDDLTLEPEKCPPCAVEPCTNGGVCSVSGDSYICTCPAGIGGPECQYSDTEGYCSFERSDPDCFIEKDNSGDFDWTRHLRTITANTGPSWASAGRIFYFIEASLKPVGHKARLTSNIQYSNKTRCLSMDYSMFGDQIGTLKVLTVDLDNEETDIWSESGNQGNQWISQMLSVNTLPDSRIVIEASVGGDRGDIAVDNIRLYTTNCSICTPVNPCRNSGVCKISGDSYTCTCPDGFGGPQCQYIDAIRTCTFERSDPMCFLTDATNDNLNWIRQRRTWTTGTGPSWAPVGIIFTYLECTGKSVGSTARFISKVKFSESTRCLTFWYHMYGTQIGTLRVISMSPSNVETEIWSKSGNHGFQWLYKSITVHTLPESKIIIEASVGGDLGDIALDHISLSMTSCSDGK